jgi:hypothetical protein
MAAQNGCTDIAILLLDYGAPISYKTIMLAEKYPEIQNLIWAFQQGPSYYQNWKATYWKRRWWTPYEGRPVLEPLI